VSQQLDNESRVFRYVICGSGTTLFITFLEEDYWVTVINSFYMFTNLENTTLFFVCLGKCRENLE